MPQRGRGIEFFVWLTVFTFTNILAVAPGSSRPVLGHSNDRRTPRPTIRSSR